MKKIKNTRKRFVGMMLAVGMMISLAGCGEKSGPEEKKSEEIEGTFIYEGKSICLTDTISSGTVEGKEANDAFTAAVADFSIDLFRTSVAFDSELGKNVLISPESVIMALGMTANGASGDTLADMERILTQDIGLEDYNKYLYEYNKRLGSGGDVIFHNANSLWIRDDEERIQVKDEFLHTDKDYYGADVFMAPFDETTINDINSWVDENTNGMLKELINEIPEEEVICLLNAIAFEGEWANPFEDYQIDEDGIFINSSGEEEKVTMLGSSENIYIQDDNASGFIKPYKGGEYGFMAILPNEGVTVSEYISGMSGGDFLKLYENRSSEKVDIRMPEFSYDYTIEMKDALSDMGLEGIFVENADFSRMADTETGELFINRVLHKTYIQVDRYGTKAAAATAVFGVDSCAIFEDPKSVELDRPFIYSIIDMETGIPVFIGVTNSVSK